MQAWPVDIVAPAVCSAFFGRLFASMQRKHRLKRIALLALLLPCIVNVTAHAAFNEGRDALENGDYATALIELQPLADQGHSAAQVLLGEMYLTGRGTPQDDQRALQWFRKAAAQGEAIAENNVGVMYQGGRGGLPQDDGQAVAWYRKAADQGFAPAQNNLGNMFLNGTGVSKDDRQAAGWFRKAAEQGHAPAQHNLANMYLNGLGIPRDDEQAVAWYRRAADARLRTCPAQPGLQLLQWPRRAAGRYASSGVVSPARPRKALPPVKTIWG